MKPADGLSSPGRRRQTRQVFAVAIRADFLGVFLSDRRAADQDLDLARARQLA